ncbi:MAG: hypothetical protein N3B16_04785 [Candidatus Aminicenantes bacterium]|nr:hypothetical protein [Candidatus Aminicenantes bacterium]
MGEKNSARLPAYHRLDLGATLRFPIDKYQALAGVTLFNVYNRKNVWYKEFEIMAGELVSIKIGSVLPIYPISLPHFLKWGQSYLILVGL